MKKITPTDLENISFYQLPKWLMEMFTHNIIGVGGFKTYILMYDRLRISSKNNWIDKDDNVYIKYSYDEIMKDLNCNSKTTVSNNIKELEKLGLIAKIKKFSSSNIYYLTIVDTKDYTGTKSHTSKSPKRYTDEITESYTDTSTEDTYSINNNYIKNKSNKNNLSKKNLLDEIESLDISTSLKEKLSEFVDYRSEIRKPIKSFRVISNLISQLGKRFLDEDHLIGSIDMSISCGYQGIFPTKVASATTKVESYNTMMLKKLEGSDGGKSF